MKKILLLASFVFAAVSAALAQNSTALDQSAIFDADPYTSVAKGMSREAVMFQLGVPSETLGHGVWVYWNFHGRGAPDAAKYDTLVVVFADQEVATLRLAESKPVRVAVAKFKAQSAVKIASAK